MRIANDMDAVADHMLDRAVQTVCEVNAGQHLTRAEFNAAVVRTFATASDEFVQRLRADGRADLADMYAAVLNPA